MLLMGWRKPVAEPEAVATECFAQLAIDNLGPNLQFILGCSDPIATTPQPGCPAGDPGPLPLLQRARLSTGPGV